MNTHKTLRMGALGTLVAVAVLAGCSRDEPDSASSTVITPSSPSAPAGSSSSSTVTPGTSGYVGPGGSDSSSSSSSTSPSTSGSDTPSSSSSTSGSAGGPGMSSSDQPSSTSPGTSGYVGGSSSSSSATDSGSAGSTANTDDPQNRSGSGSSSGSSGDTSSGSSGTGGSGGSGGTTGNPVGPNSRLDPADRPFRDVAIAGKADPGAAWREALGVRMIRVADTQGDARKSGSGSAGMGAQPANTDKMSKKDKKFIEKAAAGGMFEVEAARLASEKASDPQIKSFAAKLMDHHQQANQELKQLADARGVMLPTKLPSKEQAMIDKLSKAEGDKFDKEFLKTVGLRDHKEDIRQFENAQNETSDAELKAWIAKTLPTLRTHLAEAQSMSGSGPKMQGYTGSSSAQPSDASPTGGSEQRMERDSGASGPGSTGPTGTGVGGSLGAGGASGSGAGGGSGGGAAGGAAGGN